MDLERLLESKKFLLFPQHYFPPSHAFMCGIYELNKRNNLFSCPNVHSPSTPGLEVNLNFTGK